MQEAERLRVEHERLETQQSAMMALQKSEREAIHTEKIELSKRVAEFHVSAPTHCHTERARSTYD